MGKITFHNKPELSRHEVDKKIDSKKIALVPIIKEFISSHKLFSDEEIEVTFNNQSGVSSLVSIISTPSKKTILKMPLNLDGYSAESEFLQIWESSGVKVPHVLEAGTLGGYPYILMEYIDSMTLMKRFTEEELVADKLYIQMGKTLRLMHAPVAQGYGRPLESGPEYSTFKDWINSDYVKGKIEYVMEHKLITQDLDFLSEAIEGLIKHTENDTGSHYCHDDFSTGNIFATQPLTVFDPNPSFNNGLIDLCRSLIMVVSHGGSPEATEQILSGYYSNNTRDDDTIRYALLLNAILKFPFWHKKQGFQRIKAVQDYISEFSQNNQN